MAYLPERGADETTALALGWARDEIDGPALYDVRFFGGGLVGPVVIGLNLFLSTPIR